MTQCLPQRLARLGSGIAALLAWPLLVLGATADLSDTPLGTMTDGTTVRSNLMFILDDSGSMAWDYLPDDAPQNDVCFGSKDRNTIFYDPAKTYLPPLKADGTSYSNATFSGAWVNGFRTGDGTTNLTSNNPATPSLSSVQTVLSSTTTGPTICGKRDDSACRESKSTVNNADGSVTTTSTARGDAPGKVCSRNTANSCTITTTVTTTVNGPSGRFLWAVRNAGASTSSCQTADFTVVRYSAALSAAQLQNYANWYSYYRTRMLAMRSAAGRAFASIDSGRFRVGFTAISETGVSDGSKFLNIRNYDSGTQKADFFTRLYGTSPSGYTPLRPALEKTGRYFANKISGQTDPMQYACQRNYAILSTDGYWNTSDETNYRASYVPWKLDNTAIGNPDGGASVARPLRDEAGTGQAGISNTLADIAMYFYETDLRTAALGNCSGAVAGQDVCENKVPSDGKKDTASHQHMTTFTLGLGVSGLLIYDKNYETQTSGDFWALRQGTKVWPDPKPTSTSTSVTERIDDLWHAAVNGRGFYYAANDATDLAASLVDALGRIEATTGSAAAAATSSLTPSAGDDWLFVPLYTTKTWDGTINAFRINTATGEILDPLNPLWSAADRIKAQATRNIYFRSVGGTNSLASFAYANLSASDKAKFDNLCLSGAEKLTQCSSLDATAKAKVTGTNVVEYLRGTTTYETTAADDDNRLFRSRTRPLGDIVNGAPVYVKKPPFKYADTGYSAYVAAQANRQAVLYVAANDGMLHALKVSDDATGGTELWAYVPSLVMQNMYLLADTAYETKHHFYVDSPPVVADVYDGSAWRSILIGGLGKGGRGYYALDVTDPSTPKSLWEYSNDDLGYSYGSPVVTKNKAGTWVVAFASGYNNVSPGDGYGHVYVLNAVTGALIKKLTTAAGSTTTPSNLGKLNAWVDDETDNTAKRFYGGDMLGNVWRFDFDDNLAGNAATDDAFLLGKTGSGQPITTKPVLSEVTVGSNKYPVVSVATGRYLGVSDVGDGTLQSIYTFKDALSSTSLDSLRSNTGMVKQTIKSDRSGLDSPVDINWASQNGWYVDLRLSSGERVNVDFDMAFNQLVVASNIPTPTVCSPGGTSWLYYFDISSGKVLLSYSSDTLVAGITTIVSSTGKLVTLVQGVNGKNSPRVGVDPTVSTPGPLRRTSWRELVD